jgi:uncharacterized protein (TIGR02001 family)
MSQQENKMTSKLRVLLCAASVVLGTVTTGSAEEEGVSFSITADFFSKYVWRGQNVTDDWVFQPGVSATYGGWTGGFWGNLDLTDENGESSEFIEYDWYVDYSGQVNDTIGYSVGGIYYHFPGGEATTEIYAGLSLDVVANPSVTVYYDIDEVDGAYVAFGIGHTFEDLENLPFDIDLSANLGWGDSSYNDSYWSTPTVEVDSELNDLTLSAAFPFELGPVTVTPSVHYVALLGGDVSDVADDDSLFYAGISLAYEF